MSDLLNHFPKPRPNVDEFIRMLGLVDTGRVPPVELAIAEEVLADIKGQPLIPRPANDEPKQLREWAADRVNLWHALGYDYYPRPRGDSFLYPRHHHRRHRSIRHWPTYLGGRAHRRYPFHGGSRTLYLV